MVTIIDYRIAENSEGKPFTSLKLQGGIEPIQSQQTGRFYLTAKTCLIPSTFDETTAKALVGSQMPGKVERVYCEPYDYTIKETGETISLSYRYEYQPEDVYSSSAEQDLHRRELVDFMG